MDRRGTTYVVTVILSIILAVAVLGYQSEATEKPKRNKRPVAQETACKPDKYAYFIGHDKSALNTVKLPERTRILGPNTITTADYTAKRLNFIYDDTGKIISVKCG